MADIKTHLNNIKGALYGKDVRNSIHDAIEQCYTDASINGNANMEVTQARGTYETLGKRLDNYSSQLAQKASENDLDIERKRIDSFVRLEQGSTAGDAELIDARIGYDGVNYENLGNAIRTQIKNIDENKNSWANIFFFEGKNPYWDTINKTFTIYSGSPILVNGLSYISDIDITLSLDKINSRSYLGLYINLSDSTSSNVVLDIISMQDMTPSKHKYKNYALIAVFNVDTTICQANFIVNIDGVLQYSTTKETIEHIKENNKSNYVKFLRGEENDIFDGVYIDNEYFDAKTGEIIANDEVSRTDYIYIKGLTNINTLVSQASTHQVAYFNKDKEFIGGEINKITGNWHLSIPLNAYYVSIAVLKKYKDSFYVRASIDESRYQNSKYRNMKMNCLGDSITFGYIPDSGKQMEYPYPSILQNLLEFDVCRNYGISGSTLAKNSGNYDPMSVRYLEMNDDADIVSVFGGTNDYGRQTYSSLGTISDTTNETVYGALDVLCNGLINKFPKAFIFFITPLRRADKTGDNKGGYSLEDISNAIKDVCYKYSIPVLDLYSKGGCHLDNDIFRAEYGGNDKLHINQKFMLQHLAPMIEKFIRSNI